MPSAIILHVDQDGAIVGLEDELSRCSLRYSIRVQGGAADPRVCDTMRLGEARTQTVARGADGISQQTQCMIPFINGRFHPPMRFPGGMAYVLDSAAVPSTDADVPFNLDYAGGLSLIEIVPEEATYALVDQYFQDNEGTGGQVFSDAQFVHDTCDPTRAASPDARYNDPGVCSDPTALDALRRFSSDYINQDPFLEPFQRNFEKHWWPTLRPESDNFVGIFKSDWRTVPTEMQKKYSAGGPLRGGVHYYIACKYSLPISIADQVLHLLITNPHRRTWKEWAGALELARAEKLSCYAREHIMRRCMARFKVCPAPPGGTNIMHTTYSVLRNKEATTDSGGRLTNAVVYGADLCSTLDATCGILSAVDTGPGQDLIWWFGAPNCRLGGGAWRSPGTASCFPSHCGGKITGATMDGLREAGYDPEWGFVKLTYVRGTRASESRADLP